MKKILVAYFSANGTTAEVAIKLANSVGADTHEIIPLIPYTKEDLDWTNPRSRSITEMKDKSYHPQIENRIENMEQYDIIFIGFPIWDYSVPTIIHTFLEQYNLSGKTIIPFATSRLTGIDIANSTLRNLCIGANFIDGERFSHHVDSEELKTWAEYLLSDRTLFY